MSGSRRCSRKREVFLSYLASPLHTCPSRHSSYRASDGHYAEQGMQDNSETKTCVACGQTKPIDKFAFAGNSEKHRRNKCKACKSSEFYTARIAVGKKPEIAKEERQAKEVVDDELAQLFRLTKKDVLSLDVLCDKLDKSPKRVRALLQRAQAAGLPIHVEHDFVGVSLPQPRDDVQETNISPIIGERTRIAVISDTHFGSKYCMRGAIKDFIAYAYSKGCRVVLHVGDILDGDYRHGKFEMTHMGLSAQVRDLEKNLPTYEDLTYHAITGNHDFTFTEESGVNVGEHIKSHFLSKGRHDFFCYGDRGAFIDIMGAVVHLWHPKQSPGYAVSYQLQKKIEAYAPGDKPQILLTGHWHRFGLIEERGVQAIACPTFQSGGSAFSKSLTSGAPAIGGLILEWDLTAEGTMRNFSLEKRSYFVRETKHRVESPNGVEV